MAPISFLCSDRCRVRRPRAALSQLRKPKNKIAAQIATFLRLGIVVWRPIADRDTKMQGISRKKDPFPLCGGGKEPVIAKKLQKSRDFCFHTRRIAATRRILRKTCRIPATKKTGEKRTDTATGQITHKAHETQPRRWGWVPRKKGISRATYSRARECSARYPLRRRQAFHSQVWARRTWRPAPQQHR